MKYLRLVRYQNLLMLALMQLLLRYGFLKYQDISLSLADWQFGLLVLATVLIAAAGYVINDIMDQDTDKDNKPKRVIVGNSIPESMAYNIYIGLNVTGVGAGFYLSNVIERPGFAAIFIVVAATLYLYATSLKQMLIVGNILVALLLSFSVIIVGIFDLFPATYEGNQLEMATVFSILSDYAVFAFIINLLREIVKDIEDVDGDYNSGMNTLPIVLGISRTAKVAFILSFIPVIALLYYINAYLIANNLWILSGYALLLMVGPLLYFAIKMYSAKKKKEFSHLSKVLKLVILSGILSIGVLTYNLIHHA
jgi:4-hydroxybenzoate polyprenyltransferase